MDVAIYAAAITAALFIGFACGIAVGSWFYTSGRDKHGHFRKSPFNRFFNR